MPYFVHKVVQAYEGYRHSAAPNTDTTPPILSNDTPGPHGKQATNLLLLLTSLYNLRVISCVLVFDLVRALLEEMGEESKEKVLREEDVELILIIVRST